MPDTLSLPFVENCGYIKPLLEERLKESGYHAGIEQILRVYTPYQQSLETIVKEHFTENRVRPSEREMEIARLAVHGLTNKENRRKTVYIGKYGENGIKKYL